ncbi:MAG: glycosyltransferase family 39 protein [Acidimicrobiales bacterium]|nr:glycosyltransferase family 39 protein [Acidimicrobiales bacterium]MCB1258811.1 glycosyltransferase family 39 protein [Acidimicrobiales bacterium]
MRVTSSEPDRVQDPGASAPAGDPDEPVGHPPTSAPIEIVVLALLAVAVGVVLRFVAHTPLWLDEALSANIAALPPGEILSALEHDGHPPLYYLLLHGWMQLVGEGDEAVRALSGLISVASLPVAWFVGRRRGGPLLGWVFVAVLALSPFAQRYATETRMYSLVALLVLVGYLLVDDAVRRGRGGWRYPVIGLVAGALMLSHYWAMYLLAAVGLLLVWHAWRRRGTPLARRCVITLAWMVGGVVVVFGWWVPSMLYQAANTGTPWAAPTRPTVTASIALVDLAAGTGGLAESPLLAVVTAVLFALGLFGVAVGRTRVELDLRTNPQVRPEAIVVGLTMALGIVAGYAASSAFASRYASVLFPLYLLVAAAGVTRFVSRPVRAVVLGAVLALGLVGGLFHGLVQQRTQAELLAQGVADNASPGDVVVYCPDQLGPATSRALVAVGAPELDQVTYPALTPPQRVDWVGYGERHAAADPAAVAAQVDARAGADHGVFVVWAGTYRTLEGQCEALVGALNERRGNMQFVVGDQGEKYYEHGNLTWFPAKG